MLLAISAALGNAAFLYISVAPVQRMRSLNASAVYVLSRLFERELLSYRALACVGVSLAASGELGFV